ncbi:hypothetical protein BDD12DRAFT_398111 [Trichophaea hybrida]|nr:hypothetical protein BDD12DRAFT_398111 [Trichophaea hybrida]
MAVGCTRCYATSSSRLVRTCWLYPPIRKHRRSRTAAVDKDRGRFITGVSDIDTKTSIIYLPTLTPAERKTPKPLDKPLLYNRIALPLLQRNKRRALYNKPPPPYANNTQN